MKRIILAILLLSPFISRSQNCAGFHNTGSCLIQSTYEYKSFSQSRSILSEAKRTYKYQVSLFGGYDYKMSICTKPGFGPIHFRIINADDETVFFDNHEDDYIETVGFTNEITKNVIFEITVLATKKEPRDIDQNRTCLGINILWKKVPKMGF